MAGGLDTGTTDAWLPPLPNGWDVQPLGRHSWIRARLGWKGLTADEYVDSGVPMLSTPDIKTRDINFARANRITRERYEESPEIQLAEGDVLLTKDGATIGIVNVVTELPEPATVNGSIAVVTTAGSLDPRYLAFALASSYGKHLMLQLQGGMGVPHLFQADIKRMRIPLPPVAEQRVIADFLDRETAKIDALIEKQNALIDRLRERRDAVIWSVSLGQPRRPSDADAWYGTPPSSWLVEKLGRHCRIVNGSTPSRDNLAYWSDGTHPWLNSSAANLPVVDEAIQFVTDVALAECHLPKLSPGTVLLGITGEGRTRGMATLLNMEATINQHLAAVVPRRQYWEPTYLVWLLRAAYSELRFVSSQGGSTKGALTCADVHAFKVPRPPLDEQRRIAARLDREMAQVEAAVSKSQRFVELASERRAALITAAVTGQIDVGQEAAA